jgi:hypothetical protein
MKLNGMEELDHSSSMKLGSDVATGGSLQELVEEESVIAIV